MLDGPIQTNFDCSHVFFESRGRVLATKRSDLARQVPRSLGNQIVNDMAVDVGQTEVAALISVR